VTRVLVSGGVRSGKSAFAETLTARLAPPPEPAVYVATGRPADPAADPDWATRVATHRDRRPATWSSVETCELVPLLADADGPPLLIDCLGTWLTDACDRAAVWDGPSPATARALAGRLDALVDAWAGTRRSVVLVTNEVGWGVHPPTRAGRFFADELGALSRRLAAAADEVWLVALGLPVRWDMLAAAARP
jgi:adenosylcobinamide kinase/adenosylcobinamide-phosphate guanylyltransferase